MLRLIFKFREEVGRVKKFLMVAGLAAIIGAIASIFGMLVTVELQKEFNGLVDESYYE